MTPSDHTRLWQLIGELRRKGEIHQPVALDVAFGEAHVADFEAALALSLIHISEPTRLWSGSRMPSSA